MDAATVGIRPQSSFSWGPAAQTTTCFRSFEPLGLLDVGIFTSRVCPYGAFISPRRPVAGKNVTLLAEISIRCQAGRWGE